MTPDNRSIPVGGKVTVSLHLPNVNSQVKSLYLYNNDRCTPFKMVDDNIHSAYRYNIAGLQTISARVNSQSAINRYSDISGTKTLITVMPNLSGASITSSKQDIIVDEKVTITLKSPRVTDSISDGLFLTEPATSRKVGFKKANDVHTYTAIYSAGAIYAHTCSTI